MHPSFGLPRQQDVAHDVGLIILSEPVNDIQPVNRPGKLMLDNLVESGDLAVHGTDGTPLLVVGYGATEASQESELPFSDLQVLASGKRHFGISEFQALRQHQLHLSKNFAQGEGGVAPGDSGGPVFYMDSDPETGEPMLVQVAVMSWGDSAIAELSVNARLDVPEVMGWIDDVIWVVEQAY